jgi:tRNA threonylcarbamoyladenosine biosynthesis protein TsaE
MSIEAFSRSPADTLSIGRRLASLLRPGDVVLLAGRLGAGKTLFASGVAEGLGVAEPVVSPSFVLVRRYEGFVPVFHADVYRLESSGEFEDLELADAAREGVVLIEWGDAVAGNLPESHLVVDLTITGESERTIRVTPKGSFAQRSLGEVAG